MIRHQVYFDTLGSMKEESASWRSVFAGLSVLRLVDAYAEAIAPGSLANWAQIHSVRTAIDNVGQGDPVRGVLTAVVDEVVKRSAVDEAVLTALLAYGRALDYEASWGLATDVFTTVAKIARPEKNARLAVEANIAVGGAARRNGDWEISARAYSQAAYIADTLGDRQGVLTVQVGIANTYMAKGNLPQARSILDDVIIQAADQEMPEVQGMAVHSRAALAQQTGQKEEAVKLAYEALNLTKKPSERDRVLEDLAVGFSELGLRDAARDAHLLLVATTQSNWVRWLASINLLELAAEDGTESLFDSYAAELRNAPLGPYLRSYFLLFLGQGLLRFGRFDSAEEVLAEAVSYSDANQIHPVSFKADEALAAARSKNVRQARAFESPRIDEEVAAAVRAISDLRKASLVTA